MNETTGQPQYAIEPFLPEPDDAPDESAEQAIVRLCARYDLSRGVCLEMIDDVMEAFGESHKSKSDSDDGAALRQMAAYLEWAFNILIAYQQHQTGVAEMLMSTRTMAFELGYTSAAGAETLAELAKKLSVKKQTVHKMAEHFQKKLRLMPRPGQRDETARNHMTESRLQQLGAGK